MDDTAADIVTPRLRLVAIPTSVLEAMREAQATGEPASVPWPGVGDLAPDLVESAPTRLRLEQLAEDPSLAEWLVRGIVVDDPTSSTGSRVVGHLGGHGAPGPEGDVEIGYTVTSTHRRQGLAAEAARAWFTWAEGRGARRARICTRPDNEPSLAIARGLGLEQVGREWDEDDQCWEVVLEGPLPLADDPPVPSPG